MLICSLLTCVGSASHAQNEPGQPNANAPWPAAEKSGNLPPPETKKSVEPKPAPAPKATTEPAIEPASPPAASAALPPGAMAIPAPPPTTRHELALSADFVLGQGTITLPFGAALGVPPRVEDADRDSTYFGATYAYSLGQAWYVDFAYNRGDSSGDFTFNPGAAIPSSFTIEDDWYQVYLRYTFPQLRGQRLQAYLRAGVSFVQTELTVAGNSPGITYDQRTETQELYGNLGLGMNYPLFRKGRFQIRFNADAEAFYGQRSSDVTESLTLGPPFNLTIPGSDSFDSAVYGGYARATIRFQYELTQSGFLRAFLDGGAQVKYTQIDYPQGWYDELLWGPYVKAGLLYSF